MPTIGEYRELSNPPPYPKEIEELKGFYLDANGKVWWKISAATSIYGKTYNAGWYLKPFGVLIGKRFITQDSLRTKGLP